MLVGVQAHEGTRVNELLRNPREFLIRAISKHHTIRLGQLSDLANPGEQARVFRRSIVKTGNGRCCHREHLLCGYTGPHGHWSAPRYMRLALVSFSVKRGHGQSVIGLDTICAHNEQIADKIPGR
ncbi:Uncharacterised protein [Mycobacteroides abscessus subsp. abscessus]|nr:Uncharacterised protein [Mycobacteroides abscessus subsp. abscessus]SKW52855.1 Uncharacterised protein [Mycobacteroides abscessus subsp. abscessus]SLJ27300.1 Uncharacterised protein [Mycobacteroides abscessus subsp. abscessus]